MNRIVNKTIANMPTIVDGQQVILPETGQGREWRIWHKTLLLLMREG